MRKQASKKLRLSVETLRNLDALELANAVGGLPHTETCECPSFSCENTKRTYCDCA